MPLHRHQRTSAPTTAAVQHPRWGDRSLEYPGLLAPASPLSAAVAAAADANIWGTSECCVRTSAKVSPGVNSNGRPNGASTVLTPTKKFRATPPPHDNSIRSIQNLPSGTSGTRTGTTLVTLKSGSGPQSPLRGSSFSARATILRRSGMNSLATRSARALPYLARSADRSAVTLASCARAAEVMQLATVRATGPSRRPQPILLEIAFIPVSVAERPCQVKGYSETTLAHPRRKPICARPNIAGQ